MRQAKALKDERRALMDGRYEFLFVRLAEAIGIEVPAVEDMVLIDDKVKIASRFFVKNNQTY